MTNRTYGLARRSDPKTSHRAARRISTTDLEGLVLASLKYAGEATSYELADRLSLSLVSVSPRLRPLVKKGAVIDSGRTKPGDNGRSRTVWSAA